MAAYLYLATWVWAPLGAKDFPLEEHAAGDPIIWGMGPGLILIGCSLANFAWLALILSGVSRGRSWHPLLAWLLIALTWFGVNRYDLYNQRNGATFPVGHKVYAWSGDPIPATKP